MIKHSATCSRFSQITWQCDGTARFQKRMKQHETAYPAAIYKHWQETKAGIEDFEYALQATGWGSLWFAIEPGNKWNIICTWIQTEESPMEWWHAIGVRGLLASFLLVLFRSPNWCVNYTAARFRNPVGDSSSWGKWRSCHTANVSCDAVS